MSIKARLRQMLAGILWLVRPRLPMALTTPLIEMRIRRRIRSAKYVEDARANMHHLLDAVGRAAEAEELVPDYIAHSVWREERRWHPHLITHQRIEGMEHLREAQALGRGVVLSFVHHAEFGGLFPSLARAGVPVQVVTAGTAMAAPGPNMIQHLRVVGHGGGLLSSHEGVSGMVAALEAGEVVAAAIDVPGKTRIKFAGQQVRCSAGCAVAAVRASAPVVIATSHPANGELGTVKLHPAVNPAEFGGVDELVQFLATVHEEAVLQSPAAAYVPIVCWTLDQPQSPPRST